MKMQMPHIPSVGWAIGATLVMLFLYHLLHRHH